MRSEEEAPALGSVLHLEESGALRPSMYACGLYRVNSS